MKCPHCDRRVYQDGAVMCEYCAEAISTNEIFDMMTFNGKISDGALVVLVSIISMVGAALMGAALAVFAL